MRKKITNNLPQKLMSIVVAVFIWLIVVNVDNPTIRVSFDVPVTTQNEAYVESGGKMCLFEDGQETTRVYVTGRRKTVERIKSSDITAVADLRQAVSLDTNPVMVPITLSCRGIASENLTAKPQNISITLDDKQTQEFLISVSTTGKPGKGYEIGTKTANPEKVVVTAPKSLMQKIDKVVAEVNMSGRVDNVSEPVELTVVDKNQDKLTDSQMKYLKYIDLATPKVNVSVKLWKVKADVAIQAEYSGYPAEGYKVGKLTLTPSTVSVTGTDEALAALEEQGNTLWVPASQVDITGESQDCERQVDLAELLPDKDNMRLAADTNNKVIVKVSILPEGSESYMISTGDIKVNNIPDKLEAVFETENVELRISSEDGNMEDLNEKQIKVSADLSDMEEGTYEIPLTVKLPKGYELVSKVTTQVKLTEIQETEEKKE